MYDFGDNWRHTISIEWSSDPEKKKEYPRYVEGERRAPPEDVGGSPRFQGFPRSHGATAASRTEADFYAHAVTWRRHTGDVLLRAKMGVDLGVCYPQGRRAIPPMPLTHFDIRNTKPADKPFKISDGGGLFLLV